MLLARFMSYRLTSVDYSFQALTIIYFNLNLNFVEESTEL